MYYEMAYWEEKLIQDIEFDLNEKYERKANFIEPVEMMSIIEDLYSEFVKIKNEYEEFKQDVENNYKPIDISEQI